MSILNKIKYSSKELSNVVTLCICAMMLALRIVIGLFANFSMSFSPFAKISLNFIPIVIVAYLFGPVPAAIISSLGDILAIIIANPSAVSINPLITVIALIEGFIYGLVLYKCEVKLKPIIIAKVIVLLIPQLILTTLVLSFLYNTSFFVILLNRVLVLVPMSIFEVFIDLGLLKLTNRIYKTT